MKNRTYLAFSLAAFLALNAFPLYQMVKTGGYLYYSGAYDEPSYLSYDFSKAAQKLTRPGQFFVTWAHEAGVSGGWINFSFDLFALFGFLALTRAILKRAGYVEEKANLGSILLLVLPCLFNGSNPVINKLFYLNLDSGFIRWAVVPEAYFLPMMRTPEPQFSILLVCVALWLSLRFRNKIFLFLCLPFLYPFVAGPLAFILFSLFFKERFFKELKWGFAPLFLSYLGVCFLIIGTFEMGKFHSLAPAKFLDELVQTREPFLSFTSLAALISIWLFRKTIPDQSKFLLMAFALTPLALDNSQILTNFIAEPTDIEQYAGVYCVAVILTLVALQDRFPHLWRCLLIALGCFGFLHCVEFTFKDNYGIFTRFCPDAASLERLKADSADTAINDIDASGLASLIFPRQPLTLFHVANTFPELGDQAFGRYLCAKNIVEGNPDRKIQFESVIRQMDTWYRFEHGGFILGTHGRKTGFQQKHDPDAVPVNCPPMDLNYLLVR